MTSITETTARRFDVRSKRLAFLITALGLSVAVAATWPIIQSSCERHQGTFGAGFSTDFDINRIECRVASVKHSPTIRFWGVAPYVGVDW
jgi:hypothetical protein